MTPDHDPLRPHSHEPNPEPPSADPSFELVLPNGRSQTITLSDLKRLPKTAVSNCYIVSTGHGTSGPFTFAGVQLIDLVQHYCTDEWEQVEVVSADGFGNRVLRREIEEDGGEERPFILAYERDGHKLTRQAGSVRLIVPSETDDALRQIKWVGTVQLK